jgi:ribose-phosphate pyrophosphokinase
MEDVVIISGTSHFGLARRVARLLGKECFLPKIYCYGTGDFEAVLPCNVRRKKVFIIQTFLPDRNKVCYHYLETLLLLNAAHKASASEVNLVVPHLGWDQSDKKWTGRMSIAGEVIAGTFHYVGAHRYIGLHFHSPQFPGFFPMSCIVDHLVADKVLIEYVLEQGLNENAVLVAGDLGFSSMARKISERIGTPVINVEKERISGNEVVIHRIYGGSIKGKRVILWDDKIVRGTTMGAVIRGLAKREPESFIIIATHGLFTSTTIRNLSHSLVERVIITDTVPHSRIVKTSLPFTEVSIAQLLADAIREISIKGGSVSQLFEGSTIKG